MSEKTCDVFVIGAGQASEELFSKASAQGLKVLVAERKDPGGSCVNFGCTPSKTAIESARLASLARRADQFGIVVPTVEVDYAKVLKLARAKATESREGVAQRFGSSLVHGHARLAGRKGDKILVEVGDDRWECANVVLDVGTRSQLPHIDGLSEIPYITAETWLFETSLPRRIALLGGGYISVEMCQFYRRMGVEEVTVVDSGPHILGHEDSDVSNAVQQMLEAEGLRFRLNTQFGQIRKTATGIVLDCGGTPLEFDALFIATGRRPNTDDLGLASVGLETDDKGFLNADRTLRVSPGIFAAGDARGGPMFTHTAWDDARVILSSLSGDNEHTTDRIVPYAVFTDPPLGRVGLGEAEAREAGNRFKVLRFDMAKNAHADEARETTGFIKVLLEEETDLLLGAAVFGAAGADLIHLYSLMMAAKLPAALLRDAVITHPTYSEAAQNVLL